MQPAPIEPAEDADEELRDANRRAEAEKRPTAVSRPTVAQMGLYLFLHIQMWLIGKLRNGQRRFWDPKEFAWTAELEENWEVIRDEMQHLLDRLDLVPNFQEVRRDEAWINKDDRWKMFVLVGFGVPNEPNLARGPRTAALLKRVPTMTTAIFSFLQGEKHIPEHRGPFKGVLRYHLALRVPPPAGSCRLRVADEYAEWEEGKSIVFDDTFFHEVWKDSPGVRTVLFMDFLRPLPWPLDAINRWAFRAIGREPAIRMAAARLDHWEHKFGDEIDAQFRAPGKKP
jgi:beta-hydroxylase